LAYTYSDLFNGSRPSSTPGTSKVSRKRRAVAALKTCREVVGEHAKPLLTSGVEDLQARGDEAEQSPHARQRAGLAGRTEHAPRDGVGRFELL
jgi:hypothetical protein